MKRKVQTNFQKIIKYLNMTTNTLIKSFITLKIIININKV